MDIALENIEKIKVPEHQRRFKPDLTIAKLWSEALQENETLLHLDLSHNDFTSKEIESISDGLLDNHTLMGLHLAGSRAIIDAKGFVKKVNEIQNIEDITGT